MYALKEDEAAHPVNIGLLVTEAVLLDTATLAHLIEQPGMAGRFRGCISSLG